MNKSKTIIIPVIIVWAIFVFNFIFIYKDNKITEHKECTYESDSQCSTRRMGEFFSNILFLIITLLFLFELIGVILVSISCCNNSYCYYLTGTILLLILSILISFFYIIANENENIILKITKVLVQWIQIIVLIICAKKVDFSLGNSYLNNKLVNDFPTQGQSLQQEQEQEQEKEKVETPV